MFQRNDRKIQIKRKKVNQRKKTMRKKNTLRNCQINNMLQIIEIYFKLLKYGERTAAEG